MVKGVYIMGIYNISIIIILQLKIGRYEGFSKGGLGVVVQLVCKLLILLIKVLDNGFAVSFIMLVLLENLSFFCLVFLDYWVIVVAVIVVVYF